MCSSARLHMKHGTWKLNYLVKCDMNPQLCARETKKQRESEKRIESSIEATTIEWLAPIITHAHTNDFTRFLHSLSPLPVFFIEFYRMRVCGSDLHFTIRYQIRVGCKRIEGVPCNFQALHECLTRNATLFFLQLWNLNSNWFALFIWFHAVISSLNLCGREAFVRLTN